jgi:hypothetical protein
LLDLVGAQHRRDRYRLAHIVELGDQIQPTQRHPKQKLHSRDDAVAVEDAERALGQIQLKAPDVVGGGGVGRAAEEDGEPLAAADIVLLRLWSHLPGCHVIDHALTKRADLTHTHGKLRSSSRLTPRSQNRRT